MEENKLLNILTKAKKTRNILVKAGFEMGGISINTTKKLIDLYKKTGLKTINMSADLTKKTAELVILNHKALLSKTGEALKEVSGIVAGEKGGLKISRNGGLPKLYNKYKRRAKGDISIDEVLEESTNPL